MCSERKREEKKPRRRKDLARQQRGCEAEILLSRFWSVYFIQMMTTPSRDRRLICNNDSESIRSTAKAEMHQRTGWTMSYWLALLAAQKKSWVTVIGGRCSGVISRPRCQEALLWESCISLQTTHTLTFALQSARKEIPEAHFQFMQNHHGKTDSFHFN